MAKDQRSRSMKEQAYNIDKDEDKSLTTTAISMNSRSSASMNSLRGRLPNGEALRKYILSGPYKPSTVLVHVIEATDNSPAVVEHTTLETPANMSPENKAHFLAEKEAIHLILTGIGDDIYSTVDACQTTQEMWEAIERSTFNFFNNFSRNGQVNELRAEKLARNANPLALVATAQAERDPFYQSTRSHRSPAPSPKPSISSRSHTSTRHKGKEIAKPITPPSETASEEDSDPEQAQRDKDMQNNLALIAKYFKKIYTPTNNNLRTSSNSKNKNVDTTPRYKNDDHSGQKPKRVKDYAYHKEKMLLCKQAEQGVLLQAEQYDWLADTDEEVDEQELEAHYSYIAKIQEVPTANSSTDSEPFEHVQTNAGYNVLPMIYNIMSNLNHKSLGESISVRDSFLVALQSKQTEFEKYKAFNDRTIDYDKLELKLKEALGQIAHKDTVIREDLFHALTALDMELLIQTCLMPLAIKTESDSLKFVHELKQEMHTDLKYVESLEKEIDELESEKAEFSDMYDVILQEFVSKDVMCSYLQSLSNLDALDELQCMYLHKVKECDCLAQKLSNQTDSVSKEVNSELLKRFAKVEKHLISLEIDLQKRKEQQGKLTKKPTVVPINTRKPNSQANKSIATPNKKKVASKSTNQKPQSYFRVMYENTNKAWKWWIERQSPSGYKWVPKPKMQWVPKAKNDHVQKRIVQLILFIVDSGCTKHMTGNLKLLCNFVEKFLGTVRFGNDQFAPILGYGDLVQGNVMINRVYYVEGINHNLFSVGQFCDADLEVAFRKSTCFVRDLQGNDLLTSNHGSNLYTISLQESTSSTPLCLMAKATPTQAWLWHRRLSHINFDYINLLLKKDIVIGLPKLKYVKDQLCSSCELSKAKRSSFKSKAIPSLKGRLNLLHMDLCGPMRVASINGKKCILVIVDDYSRYTWTLFLRSKDETPEVLKDFLTMIQKNLQAPVITVRTDRGTVFLNKTLNAFFKEEGIEHQTSTARTPEQNGSKGYRVYNKRTRMIVKSIHIRFDEIKEVSETSVANNTSSLVPQRHKASDYDNPDPVPQRQDVYSSADADVPSQ
uniref:Retrovirus-related Pol polyprotein from transposon TNT 1-94 n=1 Tax=Tanacetum cinerariifolium TaxID=118510 RepID=A0A6L2L2N9_TANCI|nr:retrovirus-related Pol polyprotein from transposon TNT 1-94 [Tanacetum cinerariifolium]